MDYEIKVVLEVFCGDDDPDEITQVLQVEPSDIIRKGESKKIIKNAVYEESSWQYKIDTVDIEFEDVLTSFIEKFGSLEDEFNQLAKKYYIQLLFAIYSYEYSPSISFTSEMLSKISKLSLNIDFDIYNLEKD